MALVRHGMRHRKQADLPGRPDFHLWTRRAVVFVDGIFWHHPRSKARVISKFWDDKLRANVARDRRVNRILMRSQIQVIRIWDRSMKGDWERKLMNAVRSDKMFIRI